MRGLRSAAVGAALLLAAACGGDGEGERDAAEGGEPAPAGESPAADDLGAGVTVDTQKIATDSAKT